MFQLEVHNMVILTTTVSDEDEDRILKYIEANKEKFEYESFEESIITAVRELGIDLYKDNVETESYTADIRWSVKNVENWRQMFLCCQSVVCCRR